MTEEELWRLLEECRDFVAFCIASTYHESDKDDEEFLNRLETALKRKNNA